LEWGTQKGKELLRRMKERANKPSSQVKSHSRGIRREGEKDVQREWLKDKMGGDLFGRILGGKVALLTEPGGP